MYVLCMLCIESRTHPMYSIVLTGWAMFQHVQELMISTKVHIAFGYTLILAGVTRIIEICFLPTKSASAVPDGDGHSEQIFAHAGSGSEASGNSDGEKISAPEAFRHLPPFVCLFLNGCPCSLNTLYFVVTCFCRVLICSLSQALLTNRL